MKKLLIILLFLASSAYGEIYTWKDSRGTAHYTNSEYEIPEKYRAKAKILNLGIVEKKDNSSQQQGATSQPNVSLPVQQYKQVQPATTAQQPEAQRSHLRPNWENQGRRIRHESPSAE